MIGTKNKRKKKRGTKTTAKILKRSKLKWSIFIRTKSMFKPIIK